MSLWMNPEYFGVAESPAQAPGLLARLARRFRAADVAARESAAPPSGAAPYTGPERRAGRDRRREPRSGADRRRG